MTLTHRPGEGNIDSFVAFFIDLFEDRARAFFDDLPESLAGLSHATDGFVMGVLRRQRGDRDI
jgi:hypothetical protein